MKPRKVLLAEDDADDQLLFNEFLSHRKDIELMPIADNGVELFHYLDTITSEGDLPDLIILDQNMPRRNGLQTLRLLKETDRFAGIHVVVYSTYTDQHLIDACTTQGAFAVISKPITKEEYNQMIDGLMLVRM